MVRIYIILHNTLDTRVGFLKYGTPKSSILDKDVPL